MMVALRETIAWMYWYSGLRLRQTMLDITLTQRKWLNMESDVTSVFIVLLKRSSVSLRAANLHAAALATYHCHA